VEKVAAATLFAEAIHIIPAEPTSDMFEVAVGSLYTESQIEVVATLIYVSAGTMRTLRSLQNYLFADAAHKETAYPRLMTKVALLTVLTLSVGLEVVARFDLALVVRVGTV